MSEVTDRYEMDNDRDRIEEYPEKYAEQLNEIKDPLILALMRRLGAEKELSISTKELSDAHGYALAMCTGGGAFHFKLLKVKKH